MARKLLLPLLSALMVGAATVSVAQGVPENLAAALADKARPAADVERDALRKPGELLAFAEVKPGQKVADFIMGGGYFTRILSAAVGPTGQVHAYQPEEFRKFQASYGENQTKVVADYKNVAASRESLGALDLPGHRAARRLEAHRAAGRDLVAAGGMDRPGRARRPAGRLRPDAAAV